MKFHIVGTDGLIKRLASAMDFMNPTEKRELTDSLNAIDRQLQNNPLQAGESRDSPTVRFLFQPPLSIWFRVNERLKIAQIFAAHVYRRP